MYYVEGGLGIRTLVNKIEGSNYDTKEELMADIKRLHELIDDCEIVELTPINKMADAGHREEDFE